MANRASEPAPAPAPAPAAPAPSTRSPAAKAMGIPDFGQETADPSPVAIQWNDYDANDGGGMPTGSGPNMEGTDRPEAGRSKKVGRTNVNVQGTDAEADPDAHLDARRADEDVEGIVAKPQPGESDDEPVTVKPNASERRRAALDALAREQKTRSIEANLISERSQRQALEAKLKTATLGELLSMRGIGRDDALETMIAGKENEGAEAQLTPEQRELAEQRAKIDRLEKRDQDRETELARAQRQGYMSKVAEIVSGHEAVPVVHAALKANSIVDHDERGAPLRASEWIAGLASAEWEKAGSVEGKQRVFLKAAAEVLEDFLMDQHDPIVAAIAAKRHPPDRREVSAPRPPSLRKPSARPEARPGPLPNAFTNREELDVELKKRFRLL